MTPLLTTRWGWAAERAARRRRQRRVRARLAAEFVTLLILTQILWRYCNAH